MITRLSVNKRRALEELTGKYKKYYNCIFSIECNLRKHGAVTNQTTWNSIQRHWISLIVWFGWPAVWRRRSELIDGGSSCSAINQWTPAGAPHNSLWELLAAQLPFHLLNCCARLHSVHSASCFSFILFITPSQPAQSPRQAGLLICWFSRSVILFIGDWLAPFSMKKG